MNARVPNARVVAAFLLVFVAVAASFAHGSRRATWRVTGVSSEGGYRQLSIARLNEKMIIRYPLRADGSAGPAEFVVGALAGPDHLAMDERGTLYVTLHESGTIVKLTPGGPTEEVPDACFRLPSGVAFRRGEAGELRAFMAETGANVIFSVLLSAE